MQIRIGKLDDAESISKLLTDSAHAFFAKDFTDKGLLKFLGEVTIEQVRARIEGNFRFYVAEVDGALIGVCAIRGDSHLYYLFTDQHYHKTGIAKALWQTALCDLNRVGCKAVTVNASNFAAPAYERLGFEHTGSTKEVDGIFYNPMIYRIGAH